MMLKTISLAAIALALVTAAAPANAYDFDGTVHAQRTVNFSDLDISGTPGATALLGRIKSAARSVCGGADSFDVHGHQAFGACVSSAIDRAVAQLNSPLVSELHNQNQAPMSVARN